MVGARKDARCRTSNICLSYRSATAKMAANGMDIDSPTDRTLTVDELGEYFC